MGIVEVGPSFGDGDELGSVGLLGRSLVDDHASRDICIFEGSDGVRLA